MGRDSTLAAMTYTESPAGASILATTQYRNDDGTGTETTTYTYTWQGDRARALPASVTNTTPAVATAKNIRARRPRRPRCTTRSARRSGPRMPAGEGTRRFDVRVRDVPRSGALGRGSHQPHIAIVRQSAPATPAAVRAFNETG